MIFTNKHNGVCGRGGGGNERGEKHVRIIWGNSFEIWKERMLLPTFYQIGSKVTREEKGTEEQP